MHLYEKIDQLRINYSTVDQLRTNYDDNFLVHYDINASLIWIKS